MVRLVLPAFCLLLAGCSLPSLPSLAVGKPVEEQVGGGIVRIAVPKDSRADCATRDECILVRAAEVTRQAGATHFMLLPGHNGQTQQGYAYIKVFSFATGQGRPSGALSVDEALHFFRKSPDQAAS